MTSNEANALPLDRRAFLTASGALLVKMAAKALGLAADQLTVTDGVVHAVSDPTQRLSYAELIGGRYFDAKVTWNGRTSSALAVDTKAALKTPDQFKVIGRSFPRR